MGHKVLTVTVRVTLVLIPFVLAPASVVELVVVNGLVAKDTLVRVHGGWMTIVGETDSIVVVRET